MPLLLPLVFLLACDDSPTEEAAEPQAEARTGEPAQEAPPEFDPYLLTEFLGLVCGRGCDGLGARIRFHETRCDAAACVSEFSAAIPVETYRERVGSVPTNDAGELPEDFRAGAEPRLGSLPDGTEVVVVADRVRLAQPVWEPTFGDHQVTEATDDALEAFFRDWTPAPANE